VFAEALDYANFLTKYATPEQHKRWSAMYDRVHLSSEQKTLLGSFVRDMPVLVLAGAWCGDCVNQCPIYDHFAQASSGKINLRFLDRDAREDVKGHLRV